MGHIIFYRVTEDTIEILRVVSGYRIFGKRNVGRLMRSLLASLLAIAKLATWGDRIIIPTKQ